MPKSFTENDAICIDRFIYSEFILYKTLKDITPKITNGLNPPIINVFIDLYSLIMPLYSFYRFENPISLTSSLINSGIHYRNYFRKYKVYTNIFLVYSPNMSQNNLKYCANYNMSHINKMFSNYETKNIVDKNLELLETVIPYVNDIYYKKGTVEPGVIICSMIDTFENKGYKTKNLIISGNPVCFQIPVINERSIVYTKRRNGDVLVTDSENVLRQALSYTKNQYIEDLDLPGSYISAFYTLCGLAKLNINSLVYYNTGIEIMKFMRDNNMIMDADTLCEGYIKYYEYKKKEIKNLEEILNKIHNRYRCFDFRHQLMMYNNLPESKENSYLVQIQNIGELDRLNREYFRDNPIMIDKI